MCNFCELFVNKCKFFVKKCELFVNKCEVFVNKCFGDVNKYENVIWILLLYIRIILKNNDLKYILV